MSPRTVERVDDWDTVPFAGGYDGLRDLASDEFSGVVTAGPARLFMIRGTAVGVLDGSIEDFEGASGSAREAPHQALPLLAVMQERSDEVRAKYYTEDTPIAEVDRTLADGGFTGYVELSENVLSGDYYQVYHQGRSMSVAFVGAAERLITDDEAFEQADGEVGIFEVRPVEIEPVGLPEPSEPAGASLAADPIDATEAGDREDETPAASSDDSTTDETAAGNADAGSGDAVDAGSVAEADKSASASDTGGADADAERSEQSPSVASIPDAEADSESTDEPGRANATDPEPGDATQGRSESARDHPASAGSHADEPPVSRSDGESRPSPGTAARVGGGTARTAAERTSADRGADEPGESAGGPAPGRTDEPDAGASTTPGSAADLETRSIPSLDPARTEAANKTAAKRRAKNRSPAGHPPGAASSAGADRRTNGPTEGSPGGQPARESARSGAPARQAGDEATPQRADASAGGAERAPADASDAGPREGEAGSSSAAVESAPSEELRERERELRELRSELEALEETRSALESERDELRAERDRLQSELEEARAEVERLRDRLDAAGGSAGSDAAVRLGPAEAIDDTNLFVRYRSKGDATLETAHAGDADRSSVEGNLRLEYHTQFDADDAVVGDEPFDDFLTGTVQYRFVDWLVGSLLYEIRDTGHADGMADLYDALPKVDRAELNGQVSVSYTEDGEDHRSQERFDVVVRDRMGNPLAVANINDSRDPATESMMTELVKRAERVGESSDSLAGAFLVTGSFFEPEALETAAGATSSGLFSRDKRKSFVNLSRKGGYHLCLVEARNREFHLAVPEL